LLIHTAVGGTGRKKFEVNQDAICSFQLKQYNSLLGVLRPNGERLLIKDSIPFHHKIFLSLSQKNINKFLSLFLQHLAKGSRVMDL